MKTLSAIAILLLSTPASAVPYDDVNVEKTFDNGPVYSILLNSECKIGIQFWNEETIRVTNTVYCNRDLPDSTYLIEKLFSRAVADGIKISKYKTFELGYIPDNVWRQRLVECYIGRYGLDERRMFPNVDAHKFIDNCQIFRGLEEVFAKYGITIYVSGLERGLYFDLKKKNWSLDPEVRLPATAKHGHHGLVFDDAIVWFNLVQEKSR